jgi:predicted TIM-barrel fold metal-dependent hydrolase
MTPLKIIDADGHIREEVDAIREFLPAPFRGRKPFFPSWPSDGRYRGTPIDSTTPELWRDFMDAVGIEQAVVYPTLGLSHGLIQDKDWACALASAYNNWLYERYLKTDSRIKGVALLPVQAVSEATKELTRCVQELGMVAGLLPAVTFNRKPFGSAEYHALFAEAERLDCALAIHGSPQVGLGLEIFERHIEAHVLTHPLPVSIHFISIVFGGILEMFPKIKIAFLEAGCGWVPFLMERMDYEMERLRPTFEKRPQSAPPIQKLPSEYIRAGNLYVSCEANERSLPWVAEFFGGDYLIYPTDFPHSLTFDLFVEEVRAFVNRKDLPPELSRKVLRDNSRRLYGI